MKITCYYLQENLKCNVPTSLDVRCLVSLINIRVVRYIQNMDRGENKRLFLVMYFVR
jgi:hypothetical protein